MDFSLHGPLQRSDSRLAVGIGTPEILIMGGENGIFTSISGISPSVYTLSPLSKFKTSSLLENFPSLRLHLNSGSSTHAISTFSPFSQKVLPAVLLQQILPPALTSLSSHCSFSASSQMSLFTSKQPSPWFAYRTKEPAAGWH